MKSAPAPILSATVGMLSPYWPDLTATRLVEALNAATDPRHPAPMAEALTKAEYGAAVRRSLASVNRDLKNGRLPSLKIGRSVRIPRAAVEAMLAGAAAPQEA